MALFVAAVLVGLDELGYASDVEARERRERFWANAFSGPRYWDAPPF